MNYFAHNYVNRVVAFLNSKVRGQPVAYIAQPPKLDKGQDLSTCARCHGPDIAMKTTEIYRQYEPGYSREGRINDLSSHFKEFPLEPGRNAFTVECWMNGRPKGIGMLFRSFIESACYEDARTRCYDCHDPHSNRATYPGILEPSAVSNAYCTGCHQEIERDEPAHTHHAGGESGGFCYDCHMPRDIVNLVGGYARLTRSHTMSAIPDPASTLRFGSDGAPNACNECHGEESAAWAVDWMDRWWGGGAEARIRGPELPGSALGAAPRPPAGSLTPPASGPSLGASF